MGIDQIRTVGLRLERRCEILAQAADVWELTRSGRWDCDSELGSTTALWGGRVGIDQIRTVGLRRLWRTPQVRLGVSSWELTRSGRWDCDKRPSCDRATPSLRDGGN